MRNDVSKRDASPAERVRDDGILTSARCGAGGELSRSLDGEHGAGVTEIDPLDTKNVALVCSQYRWPVED